MTDDLEGRAIIAAHDAERIAQMIEAEKRRYQGGMGVRAGLDEAARISCQHAKEGGDDPTQP